MTTSTKTKTRKQNTTNRQIASRKTSGASSQSKIKGSVIGGAVAVALAASGGVGYVANEVITADNTNEPTTVVSVEAELPEVDYRITKYRLYKSKQQLNDLTVRSDTATVPTYNSTGVVPSGWNDADQNGCQTRYDILFASLADFTGDSEACRVDGGTLRDLYTGEIITYDNSISGGGIDIDHIVAKKDAWESGGYLWDAEQWAEYANDEDVLLPVSASANRSKGDKDAAEWLVPNNSEYACQYVIRQINIKTEYELSVSADEKAAMEEVLNSRCEVR